MWLVENSKNRRLSLPSGFFPQSTEGLGSHAQHGGEVLQGYGVEELFVKLEKLLIPFLSGHGKVAHNPILKGGKAFGNEQFFEFGPLGDDLADFSIVLEGDHRDLTVCQGLQIHPCRPIKEKTCQIDHKIPFRRYPFGHFPITEIQILTQNSRLQESQSVRALPRTQEMIPFFQTHRLKKARNRRKILLRHTKVRLNVFLELGEVGHGRRFQADKGWGILSEKAFLKILRAEIS